jgi:hypothetical protein
MKPREQKKEDPERRDQDAPIDEQTEDIARDDERTDTPDDEDIDDNLGRPLQLER